MYLNLTPNVLKLNNIYIFIKLYRKQKYVLITKTQNKNTLPTSK